MKCQDPRTNGGPGQAAYHSNQFNVNRPVAVDDDGRVEVLRAWRVAIDGLDPASLTLTHLVGRLLPIVESGTPGARDLAQAAIADVALRRGLSSLQLVEFETRFPTAKGSESSR